MTLFDNNILLETPEIVKSDTGLTIAALKITGMQKKIALLSSPFGSMIKEVKTGGKLFKIPAGTAHFLEHKLFENENGANVFENFAELGASCNAYTSLNKTSFSFSTSNDIYHPLEILLDFVQNLYLTETSILNERKIIEQEISMYNDHPGWRAYFNLLQGMYHVHPVRDDVAGSTSSLELITKDILYRCHEIFYHPENLLLVVAGDIEIERVKGLVDKSRGFGVGRKAPDYAVLPVEEPLAINKACSSEYHSVTEPIFYMGFKLTNFPRDGEGLLKKEIAYSLLLDNLFGVGSSAFYQLYDEGLIDDSFGTSFSGKFDFGHVIIGSRTKTPGKLEEKILSVFKNIRQVGLNKDDLARAKRKLWGTYLASLNSLEMLAGQFIKDYRLGLENTDHFKIIDNLKQADFDEIIEKDLLVDNICCSLIEPLAEGE